MEMLDYNDFSALADKDCVSRFTEHAERILAAAESAVLRGEQCTEMTILIGQDGAIHMVADSDWPLDSLTFHHGAQAAYRVSEQNDQVRVEGREGSRTCLLMSQTQRAVGFRFNKPRTERTCTGSIVATLVATLPSRF